MTNPHEGRTGLDRIVRATGYSHSGLRLAWQAKSAFRQETALAALLLPSSAIEAAIDRRSLARRRLTKKAKDIGRAAAFLALAQCAGVWIAALWHRRAGG